MYQDLREYLDLLDRQGLLLRVAAPVNKDTELHPLVRWQFLGLPDHERKAFLFENVVDAKGRRYETPVVLGALASNEAIYAVGMGCEPGKSFEKWSAAVASPLAPEMVDTGPVKEEIHVGDGLLEHGGLDEFPGAHLDAWIRQRAVPDRLPLDHQGSGYRHPQRRQLPRPDQVPHQDRRLPHQRPAGSGHPLEQGQRAGPAAARGRRHRRGAVPFLRGSAEDRLRGGRARRRRCAPRAAHGTRQVRDRGSGGAGKRGDRHRGIHPHGPARARGSLRGVPRVHGPPEPEPGVRGDLHHAPEEPPLRGRVEPGHTEREQQDQAPGLGVAGAGPPAQPLQPEERGPGGHARAAGEPAPVRGGADAQDATSSSPGRP